MLYCSLFLPYNNYCSEIWGNTYATNVDCITVLQKRVVRLGCGAGRLDHTNPLFIQLGILKFVDLVKFKTSIIMFKAYHNVLPDSMQKMFNLRVQIYDTRQKMYFHCSSCPLYCIDSTFALQSCVCTQASLVPLPHRVPP